MVRIKSRLQKKGTTGTNKTIKNKLKKTLKQVQDLSHLDDVQQVATKIDKNTGISSIVDGLNNSKFFAGLVMLMLNIGSKYITIELSDNQKNALENGIARQLLIFSIAWLGTRDIKWSIILTAAFVVLTQYLFNEYSSFYILPQQAKKLANSIDVDGDHKLSDNEITRAITILNKAKEDDRIRNQVEMANTLGTYSMNPMN